MCPEETIKEGKKSLKKLITKAKLPVAEGKLLIESFSKIKPHPFK